MFNRPFSNFVLHTMFILMIIVCIVVITGAYASLRYTNLHIRSIITEAESKISSDSAFVSKQQAKVYLDQLEAKSSTTLDSSTISFLFQLFTVALIGAGIYLLSESHKDLNKIKLTAKLVKADLIYLKKFEIRLAYIHQLSLSALCLSTQKLSFLFPILRTHLKEIKVELIEAQTNKVAIEKSIINLFIDDTGYIRTNLSSLHPPVKDLQVLCDDICTLLKDGKFDERYDQLSKNVQKALE